MPNVPETNPAIKELMRTAPLHPGGVNAWGKMTDTEFRKATSDELWTILNQLDAITQILDGYGKHVGIG